MGGVIRAVPALEVTWRMTLVFEPSPVLRLYPLLLAKLHTSEKGLVYETSF